MVLIGLTKLRKRFCLQMLDAGGNLTDVDAQTIHQEVDVMANLGLRVLAFAKKSVSANQNSLDHADIEKGLIFLGLQGMIDPPRDEAIKAIEACQHAGIQVKMITGDHAATARAIAAWVLIKMVKCWHLQLVNLLKWNNQN